MENQPVANPQDSQQLNELLKQKVSFLPILIAVIITAMIFGIGGFVLGMQQNSQSSLPGNTTPTVTPSPTNSLQPTLNTQPTVSPTIDASPISNGLYLDTYQGKEALFLTNSKLSEYYDDGVKKTSNEVGVLEQIDGIGRQPFRYNELTNPIRIATFDASTDVIGVGNFELNNNKSKLYVVIDTQLAETAYPNVKQELYQVDLTDYSIKLVWSHNIGDNKYPKAGPADVDIVESDKYAAIWLGICYACEGFDPHGSIVLNLQTGAEEYLGEVEDFQFNLTNNTLTYKKLAPFDEACEPSPGCNNDGKRTIYKPSGQLFTVQLP